MDNLDNYFILIVYLAVICGLLAIAGALAEYFERKEPKVRIWRVK